MSSSESTSGVSRPIRIAYLLADGGVPYLDSQKGASIHARALARAFEQEGCELDVYALRKGRRRVEGFDCLEIPKSRLTQWYLVKVLDKGILHKPFASKEKRKRARKNWNPPNWMVAIGVQLWQRDFYRCALKECRKRKPDFLYARNAWLGGAYVRLQRALGVPLALEVNAVCTIEKKTRKEMAFSRLTEKIEREAMESADVILPVTAELKEQVVEFSGVAPEKVAVTPNAVDLDVFAPGPPRDTSDPDREFIIGCVHSFKAYHGMEVLLEAAVQLRDSIPNLKLRLVGGGGELERVRRQASDMGLGQIAEFTGTVAHHDVPNFLRDCSVCVAPYVGGENLYGCPMKLYEYMALKAPIVAAAWGDIPNTLTHGQTAYLHPVGDADALAESILQVYRDPQKAEEMAQAARALVENHTWRTTARKILDWHAGRPIGDRILGGVAASGVASSETCEAKNGSDALEGLREATLGNPSKALEGRDRKKNWAQSPFFRGLYDWLLTAVYNCIVREKPKKGHGAPAGDKPIKVLRIVSSVAQGGVAKVAVQSILAMPEGGAETDILVFGSKNKTPDALKNRPGLKVINRRLELYSSDYRWRLFRDCLKLARIIKRSSPDIVHLHEPQFAPPIAIAAALSGRPTLCVHLHSVYQGRRSFVSKALTELERKALRRLPLIACSNTILKEARQWLRSPRQTISLIEDGADDVTPFSANGEFPQALRRAAGDRLIVAKMARLVPLKRTEDFLQACRILLDEGYPIFTLLMCYGKDKHKRPIQELFGKWFTADEGCYLYQAKAPRQILPLIDIGVSASALEGLGLNVLEYQIQGVCVVCSDIPAHREMVDHAKTGLLFEPTDVPDLVRTLKRALDDPELRRRIGRSGQKAAQRRRWDDTSRKTLEFYRQALS